MKIEIGAYEAKTKLPELLRQVQAGKRFTIRPPPSIGFWHSRKPTRYRRTLISRH
jgi:hypothetical protein